MRGLTHEERRLLQSLDGVFDHDGEAYTDEEQATSDRLCERGLLERIDVVDESSAHPVGRDVVEFDVNVFDMLTPLGRLALECDAIARGA